VPVNLSLTVQYVRGQILRCNRRDSFNKKFEDIWPLTSFILGRIKGEDWLN